MAKYKTRWHPVKQDQSGDRKHWKHTVVPDLPGHGFRANVANVQRATANKVNNEVETEMLREEKK